MARGSIVATIAPVASAFSREGASEQLPPHAAGLRLGEHEELGQLADAVAEDRPRIPDRAARGLLLGDPPRIAGRRQVIEQRPAGLPRGRIVSGGVRGTAGAPSEVVDGALEDIEADLGIGGGPGSEAGHDPSVRRAILRRMPEVDARAEPELDVPIGDIRAAAERLSGLVHRTPVLTSTTAAAWTRAATGATMRDERLVLKAEHLQKTGSFKARGMSNRIATLTADARERGVITLSAGNAGQAYAWAGRAVGVPVTVVMPAGAVRSKVDACLGYGARVILHGDHVGDTFAEMERIRDVEGLAFVHPFDDPTVIAGHGTAGLELLEDVPDLDVLVIGVGGGGLISGVAAAVKALRPSIRVIGVEPERSNALSLALERGEVVTIQPQSVADGLGAPFAGAWTLAMARRHVDAVVLLDDATILAGLRFALERLKQVVEPAGAAALAALLAGQVEIRDGERVGVLLSGGNVEVSRIGELVAAAGTLPGAAT
jgi:threonine dehydratase